MRRRTTATTTIAALVLTLAAGTASTAATTDPPPGSVELMPGTGLYGYPNAGTAFTSDALYTLTPAGEYPEYDQRIESDLYTRSLEQGSDTVTLGEAMFVAHASGYAMAEHDGDLAYLRRSDGHLVIRTPDGSETAPTWGGHDDFVGAGPSSMSSSWIAVGGTSSAIGYVGGAIYSRSTGSRHDLLELSATDPILETAYVSQVQVSDDRVMWVFDSTYDDGYGTMWFSAVYTVALGPNGPTGPVTMLDGGIGEFDAGLGLAGFFGPSLVWGWVEPTDDFSVVHLFRAEGPEFAAVEIPTDDVWYATGAGDRILTTSPGAAGGPVIAQALDLFGDAGGYAVELPSSASRPTGDGFLVAYQGLNAEHMYLTDLKGRTFTDAQPPSAPVVGAVEPPSGSVLGGTTVTVRGTGFTGATQVTFGGTPGMNLQVVSPTKLTVRTPAGTAGVVPVVVSTPAGTSAPAPDAQFAYTELVTQTPLRGVADWSVPAGAVRCQQVAGTNGVPAEATGVVVNVTTVHPTGPGYVVVYPDTAGNGATVPPNSSTVNFEPGADVANGAFVALPDNGKICYSTRGAPNAGVLIDVTGYTLDGSGIVTQPSTRLLDTRAGASHVGEVTGPVNGHQVYTVDVAGRAGVPDDATAVLLNVTVAGVSTLGNLRVFPGGQDVPGTSVLNYAAGREKANGSIVALGPDGTISFWSDTAGTVQVILDVVGYVEAGSAYHGIAPERVMDTRGGGLRVGPIAGPLTSGRVYSLPLAGVDPVPADATAVVLNVTAIGPTSIGNLRVYPDSDGTGTTPPPTASSINYIPGRDIPNQVVVALPANGQVNFYNDGAGGSTVHLAVDVAGYITTPQDR